MNPADLTLPTLSPTLTAKTLPTPQSSAQKNGKTPVPRVDLEPIYTQLKAALGDGWAEYKVAVNAFVLGNLNQAELSWVLQPLLSTTSSSVTIPSDPSRLPTATLHLHNSLLAALHANTLRDPPPSDVAPWVVATDKPAAASKTAGGATGANDKTEERLKRETMALHARDRRRIKALKESGMPVNDGFAEMQHYAQELAAKLHVPDPAPTSAGGGGAGGVMPGGRTNWDLEIRRRYAQPLASETLEFPTPSDVQSRIEPIAAEEGLLGGTQTTVQACAELVEQATEVYLKELIGNLCEHSRSNGVGCVQTAGFRRQARREEEELERGVVARNSAGLLPVDVEVLGRRGVFGMEDMRLAMVLEDVYLRRERFLGEGVWLGRWPAVAEAEGGLEQARKPAVNGVWHSRPGVGNGPVLRAPGGEEQMPVDEMDYWQGGGTTSRTELLTVLDDCMAVG